MARVLNSADTYLPVSQFIPKEKIANPGEVDLWLKVTCVLLCALEQRTRAHCQVDGQVRQKGTTKDMLFSVDALISYISGIFTLQEGDCILTGELRLAIQCC